MIKVFIFFTSLIAVGAAREACYPHIGCFSDDDPFDDLPLPKDPFEDIPPTYYLHRTGQPVKVIHSSMELKPEVAFLIHGYASSYESDYNSWYKRAIEELQKVNPNMDVIALDWEKGARIGQSWTIYYQAASNTRTIGAAIANFIDSNPNVDTSKFHCIGFSLGAHVCGFSGKALKRRWGRISSIEPAGPGFLNMFNPKSRVDKEDADFVDAVHTSACGQPFSSGHSDFWLNDVRQQPGCYDGVDGIIDTLDAFFGCSHSRSKKVYIETINPAANCDYAFCPCSSFIWSQLGFCGSCKASESAQVGYRSIESDNRGDFYGDTTGTAPFCAIPHQRKNRIRGF